MATAKPQVTVKPPVMVPSSNVLQLRLEKRSMPPRTKAFRLKIALQGAQPPIRRRIELALSTRLSDLHEIIQLVFEWEDCHLHNFEVGGHRGIIYAPNDQVRLSGFEDGSVDESRVTIAQILQETDDRFRYIYDFGDDWKHDITLEAITFPDAGRKLL